MATILKKDRFTYEQEYKNFNLDLRRFHDGRGTAFASFPRLGGKEVDLYLLYSRVTALGGYDKVNNEEKWDDLFSTFNLPTVCTNGAQALKQIYSRYLFLFERLHFLGEDPDRPDEEDEGVPHKAKHQLCTKVPMSYNYRQHLIPGSMRVTHGLSQNLRHHGLYDKLEKSLLSGLPNEVDFALNVCTLLSNEGRHVLQLDKSQSLLSLIMAHVGIFSEGHDSLLGFHDEWKKLTGRNFIKFWMDSVFDVEVRDLILPGCVDDVSCDSDAGMVLNQGRELGINDAEGQRVTQLASVIQNLSFEPCNQTYMASNVLVFRFILLCIYSKYGSLHQTGLDTMSNISARMMLEPVDCWTTQIIVKTIQRCLTSLDKHDIIKGMELLTNLCQVDENDQILSEQLEARDYRAIVRSLCVADIQMLVHALEVLYQLSELGETTTEQIAVVPTSIDILVSLITVEAQSFGQNALMGIKVVEYAVPQPVQPQNPPPQHSHVAPVEVSRPDQSAATCDPEALAMCATWVKCNFEGHPLCSVNKAEIYRVYVDCMQRHGFTIISSVDFMKAISMVYPQRMSVAHVQRSNGTTDVVLKGLRRRPILHPFPPPANQTGRRRNQYNFIKQATASAQRAESPSPVSSSKPLQGPLLPPLSPHISPPLSPAAPSPPPGNYHQASSPYAPPSSDNNNLIPKSVLSETVSRSPVHIAPKGGSSMVKHLLVHKVHNRQRALRPKSDLEPPRRTTRQTATVDDDDDDSGVDRKRHAPSPEPHVRSSKTARDLSPSYEQPGCHLEVCGDVERAQDVVRDEELIHEARIERIENQCANSASTTASQVNCTSNIRTNRSRLQNGIVPLVNGISPLTNAPMEGRSRNGAISGSAESRVKRLGDESRARGRNMIDHVLEEKFLMNGVLENGGHKNGGKLVNGYLSDDVQCEDSNLVPSTGADDEDELLMAINNISADQDDEAMDDVDELVDEESVPDSTVFKNGLNLNTIALRDELSDTNSSVPLPDVDDIDNDSLTNDSVPPMLAGRLDDSSLLVDESSGGFSGVIAASCQATPAFMSVTSCAKTSADDGVANCQTRSSDLIFCKTSNGHVNDDVNCAIDRCRIVADPDVVNNRTIVNIRREDDSKLKDVCNELVKISDTQSDVTDGNGPSEKDTDTSNRDIVEEAMREIFGADMNLDEDSQSSNSTRTPTPVQQPILLPVPVPNTAVPTVLTQHSTTIVSSVATAGQVVGLPANAACIIVTGNVANVVSGGQIPRLVIQQPMIGKPLHITLPTVNSAGNKISITATQAQTLVANAMAANRANSITVSNSGVSAKTVASIVTATGSPIISTADSKVAPSKITARRVPASRSKKCATSKDTKLGSSPAADDDAVEKMCEWDGCKKCFEATKDVFIHVYNHHLKQYGSGPCMWSNCDKLSRQRFSLVTHVQDRHCSDAAMKASSQRRNRPPTPVSNGPDTAGVPSAPPPPPIYPNDAAIQAIRRFSARPPYPEFMEHKEGPVTKHIRLTSAIILRNLARYSAAARSIIKRHEHKLAYVALSPLEASTPISNCLWELHQHH